MHTRSLSRSLLALALVVTALTAFSSTREEASARRHTRLVRSEPAKDSTVRVAPTELRLWFSETLDLGVTRIVLTDAARQPIATRALTRDAATDAPIITALDAPLPDGNYSVAWSTSSKDGHPVRGTFRFSVRVAR